MVFRIGCLLACVTAALYAASERGPRRLHDRIDDSETFRLKGQTHPALAVARDLGAISLAHTSSALAIHFSRTRAQAADLAAFNKQLQDPSSSRFHKFLTPEEFADRFGVSSADLEQVKQWLEEEGFSKIEPARSRTWIKFSGDAGQIQTAFHTTLHRYSYKGETHVANATDPRLPKALHGMVSGMLGLHDFQLKPHVHVQPQYTVSAGSNYLMPDDFATIYDLKPLYGQGFDGTGVKIAVLGQSDVDLSDLRAFRDAAGLPPKDPTILLAGPDPGVVSGDQTEADLDLEWAGALAKNADIVFVIGNPVSGGGVFEALAYAVDQNIAPVISISYGVCETNLPAAAFTALSNILAQANAQGITVVAASGDSGPVGCDVTSPPVYGPAVDFPASSQYVTGIGGTVFNGDSGNDAPYWTTNNRNNGGSALAYIPETVWSDRNISQTELLISGGGASALTSKPSWQAGAGVPNDGARDVPDVAFSASVYHDPYVICAAGSCATSHFVGAGGTSAGTPGMAAIVALLVQKTGQAQGNINPRLYNIAANSSSVFHDVVDGNNFVACYLEVVACPTPTLGYSAGPGYDQATGLGSVDALNLVNSWPDFGLSINPGSITVQRGTSATAAVSVSEVNGFSGNVSLACSVGGLTNVTCSVPASPDPSAPAMLTVTAGAKARTPFLSPRFGEPRSRLLFLLFAMLTAGVAFRSSRQPRYRRPMGATACTALLIALLATTSCGSGSSSGASQAAAPAPQAETGTIVITASSGASIKTVNVAVAVPAP